MDKRLRSMIAVVAVGSLASLAFALPLGFLANLLGLALPGHSDSPSADSAPAGPSRSAPGPNEWNRGREPQNWWEEIQRYHGHVGPWNVFGWRVGKAALREFGAQWGDHTLDVLVHIPLAMPYSCLADGLTVGTGNSIGRLDIRLAEVLDPSQIQISVRRKEVAGPTLVFHPNAAYLRKIESRPKEELESLARECQTIPESDLFDRVRIDRLGAEVSK